jgi:hypothetical protein
MPESSDNPMDLLNAAVTSKAAITVVNCDRADKSITGQFVASAKPGEPGIIWARPAVKDIPITKGWASVQTRVSVRFTAKQINAGAEAVIVKQIRDYWLTDTIPISAFLLQEPSRVWVEQRETTRFQPRNDGGGIRAALARRTADGELKTIGPESQATLWDIGLGGAGFICPFNRSLLETAAKKPFDVTVHFSGRQAVLPGMCTFVRAQGNLLRIGIKFDSSAATSASIILLNQVIAEMEKRTAQWERRSA